MGARWGREPGVGTPDMSNPHPPGNPSLSSRRAALMWPLRHSDPLLLSFRAQPRNLKRSSPNQRSALRPKPRKVTTNRRTLQKCYLCARSNCYPCDRSFSGATPKYPAFVIPTPTSHPRQRRGVPRLVPPHADACCHVANAVALGRVVEQVGLLVGVRA